MVTKISLILGVVFAILWFVTPKESVYETDNMEMVSTKKVFLLITVICCGFLIASILWW